MPFSVYAAMLGSQLIVTVADRVPDFDVGRSCRESSVPDCLNMEKIARDKLTKDWPTFTAHDRAMCMMEEKIAGPPSYVGWLTCLGINANARSPEAKGTDSTSLSGGTGGTAAPKRHYKRRNRSTSLRRLLFSPGFQMADRPAITAGLPRPIDARPAMLNDIKGN